ncbi:MAG: hypothetical protein ACYC96_00800 [Fimbriimonadaceae bacterium]
MAVALKGVPNRGTRFEAAVAQVLRGFPSSFDGDGAASPDSLVRPAGWPEATIVTVGGADITFLVESGGRDAKVHVLRDSEDGFPTFSALNAARFGAHLVVFGRVGGADYDAPSARVYMLSRGHWHETQARTAKAEEAWLGQGGTKLPEFKLDPTHPGTIRFLLELRDLPRHFNQCHLCPWLRFEERWLFANGRLRRVWRRRVRTPLAELDQLAGLVNRGDRAAFNARVPARLRRIVWGELGRILGDDGNFDPVAGGPDSDELSDLCPKFKGNGWTVRLALHAGGWRVANAVRSYATVGEPT